MAQEPVEPIQPPGVHAYAEKSITAGDAIHFRVSSDQTFEIKVVQLGHDLDGPGTDIDISAATSYPAAQQLIRPGSYVNIDLQLPPAQVFQEMTLECWVRPWRFGGNAWQGILTQHTYPNACGVGLFLTETGAAALYLGDGGVIDNSRVLVGPALPLRQWSHIVGVWDGARMSIWLNRQCNGWSQPLAGPVWPGPAPLRLGAYGNGGLTTFFLDGDIAMPVIYSRALAPTEIDQRYQAQALQLPDPNGLLGCWPLMEETGRVVADASPVRRDGQIINHGTWMIGGPSFNAAAVPREGPYNPADDGIRGHGLRLASDDLYDCAWSITHQTVIPANQKPGIYVGRLLFGPGGVNNYDVTFVIKKPPAQAKAKTLVLCSTNTWLAYNSVPFPDTNAGAAAVATAAAGPGTQVGMLTASRSLLQLPVTANCAPGAPGYSCYQNHLGGQPTYYVGMAIPWPTAGPYVTYSEPFLKYSHLMRAERFAHKWLADNGFDFDVTTDTDLSLGTSSLDGYAVVVINGHSEYWTAAQYQQVAQHLGSGGRVVVLSGNTGFWRVSFEPGEGVMECRKMEGLPGGHAGATMGETYHSTDRMRGGLMRESGYPLSSVLGMESAGFGDPNVQPFAGYTVDNAAHPLFSDPESLGLNNGDVFAAGSVGHEWDVRVGLSQQGAAPSEPPEIVTLAHADKAPSDGPWDYRTNLIPGPAVISQVTYWEPPGGGRIFFAGSVAAGWCLHEGDAMWQALLRNVLHQFLTP